MPDLFFKRSHKAVMFKRIDKGNIIIWAIIFCCACSFLSCSAKRPPKSVTRTHFTQSSVLQIEPVEEQIEHSVEHALQHPVEDSPEKKLQESDFEEEFKKMFKKMSGKLPHAQMIYGLYEQHSFQPILTPRFLPGNQLQDLLDYLHNSAGHGLDTALFSPGTISAWQIRYHDRDPDATLENFRTITGLELAVAASLVKYSNALQFGFVNPFKIYKSYTIPTLAPDSSSILRIFEVENLKGFLEAIQPTDKGYQAMQKMLTTLITLSNDPQSDTVRALTVNLERLRWKNKPAEPKYVSVNIANFTLDVIENERSILHMKVCVGEPGDRETPQLGSMIHSVQVNPVWNIPQSIARNEIAKRAAEDPHYLANSNINVYRKGKLVGNPAEIDWTTADLGEYSFQQQPGKENALGKIKFLFNNESSVYLHDTPVQKAFKLAVRAVSHGCVRVEKPLDLAFALFGKGEKYNLIKKAMESGRPQARYISLPEHIPIRLYYYTAWADKDQKMVRFCNDVYGLDEALYNAVQPFK